MLTARAMTSASVASGPSILLATGGAGQIYSNTTNPAVATADGVAMAYHAGAEISDMEFVQFHPTALRLPGVPPFLISEAVRGEGAILVDQSGSQFVNELAPRDVVARAIYERVSKGSGVYLDLRRLDSDLVRARFPHIHSFCLDQGIDITKQPLPVSIPRQQADDGAYLVMKLQLPSKAPADVVLTYVTESPSWNPVPSYTNVDAFWTTHACPKSTCSSYIVPTSASSGRFRGASR